MFFKLIPITALLTTSTHGSINWLEAARMDSIVNHVSKHSNIKKLADCVPPGTESLKINFNGADKTTALIEKRFVELKGVRYRLALSENGNIPALIKAAEKVVEGFSINLEHENRDCKERVLFFPEGTPVLTGWAKAKPEDKRAIRNTQLSKVLSAIRWFHSSGLLVDFENIGFTKDGRLQFIGLFRLKQFVDVANHRRLGSPDEDYRKLIKAIEAAGFDVATSNWRDWVKQLPIASLNGEELKFRSIEDLAKSGDDVCLAEGLIVDSSVGDLKSTTLEEGWKELGGPALVRLIRNDDRNKKCRLWLAGFVVSRLNVLSRMVSVVQLALWLNATLGDWPALGLCSRLNGSSLLHPACPRTDTALAVRLKLMGREEKASKRDAEDLWKLIDKSDSRFAMVVANFLLRVANPKLEGLKDIYQSELETVIRILKDDPWFASLLPVLGSSVKEKEVCQLAGAWDGAQTEGWIDAVGSNLANRLGKLSLSGCKMPLVRFLLSSAEKSWKAANGRKVKDMSGLATVCASQALQVYVAVSSADETLARSLFDQLWMCGRELPLTLVCNPYPSVAQTYKASGRSAAEFIEDFGSTNMLLNVEDCGDQGQYAVSSLISLMSDFSDTYKLTRGKLTATLRPLVALPLFCSNQEAALVSTLSTRLAFISTLCPNLAYGTDIIRANVVSAPALPKPQYLNVRSTHAFTDSLELLANPYAEINMPTGVLFDAEMEVRGDWIQEWLKLTARAAAKELFSADRRLLKDDAPDEFYFAFGRLIGIALHRKTSLGLRQVPADFFSNLLSTRADLKPIERIKNGLEIFFPVSSIRRFVNANEFRALFL